MKSFYKSRLEDDVITFDHLQYDQESDRLLACGIDEYGQPHKTPIFRLSSTVQDRDRVIVFDNDIAKFVLKTTGKEEALKKFEELTAFIHKHRHCASNYMP